MTTKAGERPLRCRGCGGPHQFDTSIPSGLWNAVVRAKGLPEFLCTTCIVREFVNAGVSFTAELYGSSVNRPDTVPTIRVEVGGVPIRETLGDELAWARSEAVRDALTDLRAAVGRKAVAWGRPDGEHRYQKGDIHKEVADCGACGRFHAYRSVLDEIDGRLKRTPTPDDYPDEGAVPTSVQNAWNDAEIDKRMPGGAG